VVALDRETLATSRPDTFHNDDYAINTEQGRIAADVAAVRHVTARSTSERA
jgi:hypothetical protein